LPFCFNCGAEVGRTDKFCAVCGRQLKAKGIAVETRPGVARRFAGKGVSTFGVTLMFLTMVVNTCIGLYFAFAIFGPLALLGILLFPLVVTFYPLMYWIFEGSPGLFLVWGILWAIFILSGLICGAGEEIAGE